MCRYPAFPFHPTPSLTPQTRGLPTLYLGLAMDGPHTPPNRYTQHRDYDVGTVPRVSHIIHLGHPLTPYLSHASIFTLVLDELETTLGILGTQPRPPLARAEVARTVLRPTILYRLECCLPLQSALGKLTQRLVNYVLQVYGLTPTSPRKLFSLTTAVALASPFPRAAAHEGTGCCAQSTALLHLGLDPHLAHIPTHCLVLPG